MRISILVSLVCLEQTAKGKWKNVGESKPARDEEKIFARYLVIGFLF